MLKIKSILVSLLALGALASCSTNELEGDLGGEVEKGYDVAYVSISLTKPKTPNTRASTEQDALPEESKINELYVITFDASRAIAKDAGVTKYATVLGIDKFGTSTGGVTTPDTPIKVSTDTKYLLVVANPGATLKARLDDDTYLASKTFEQINAMIVVATDAFKPNNAYIVDEVVHSNGCAMINAGFYDDSDPDEEKHNWKTDCLLDVSANVFKASDYKTDTEALNAAKSKPAKLEIERLASKLEVLVSSTLKVGPFDEDTDASLGQFKFGKWAVDYYNTQFFPFAEKTRTLSSHSAVSQFYKSNFYTVDPNFDGTDYLTGIVKNTLDADREPKVDWADESKESAKQYKYSIENTMAKDKQKFGAATRLVLKGQYAPWKSDEFTLGKDWFRLPNGTNSKNFKSFDDLKTAYDDAILVAEGNRSALEKLLISACELFYDQIKGELASGHGTTGFGDLAEANLVSIQNGGELTKEEGCIYWYKESLNYYYYEIRHDNAVTEHMGYGKYGIVRNNYYNLTLTKVNGNGTPWYPGDGPEDPEEEEDIDKLGAYLHFEIKVAPWVYWTTGFEI